MVLGLEGGAPPIWNAEHDDMLVCVAVRPETADMSTFVFAAVEPRLFRFLPGQFMTFELDSAGVHRCYTIASPPTRPWRIEITAKRTLGKGSGWLHETLRPGMRVRAAGPMGDFSFGPEPSGKYLFLSAGSGITPMMSMARTLHDLGSDADVVFLHSARSPADLVFADELAAMGRRAEFRSVSIVQADTPGQRWDGFRGRLAPAMLTLSAPDLLARQVFCCGPARYMAAVRAMLDAAGCDRTNYHEESFDFAAGDAPMAVAPEVALQTAAAEPAIAMSQPAARTLVERTTVPLATTRPAVALHIAAFTIAFARTGRSISCPSDTTVLAAARVAGVRLPSACGKGLCGTCKSRLLSGTVEMRHGGGIRQREIDDGWALLCCAKPTSDLVVER